MSVLDTVAQTVAQTVLDNIAAKNAISAATSANKNSSPSNSSSNSNMPLTLRDWGNQTGNAVGYNPNTKAVSVGSNSYSPGTTIPGTYFDAGTNSNMVLNPDALLTAVTGKSSLIPSAPNGSPNSDVYSTLLANQPTYTPYTKDTFDDTVSGGPGSEYGWKWTKGIKSKELFDTEQQANADEKYKKYTTDLQNWQNALSIAQAQSAAKQQAYENQNAYLAALGETPLASTDDPSLQIRKLGQAYETAKASGDTATANNYHLQALALAQKAGWIQPGQTVSSVNGLPGQSQAGTPALDTTLTLSQPQYQDWYNDLYKQSLQADIADKNASANQANAQAVYYGNGGSSGGNSSGNLNAALNLYKTTGVVNNTLKNQLGGQTPKATNLPIATQAQNWINSNMKNFKGTYPAKNMYTQVDRNIKAGTMSAELGKKVKSILKTKVSY